jgi:hypothetical protein
LNEKYLKCINLSIYIYNIKYNYILRFYYLGTLSGEVLLNGEPVDNEFMSQISGFVPQQDLAIEALTVQEHMEFMVTIQL